MGGCHSDESDGLAKAIWADIINYRANLSYGIYCTMTNHPMLTR